MLAIFIIVAWLGWMAVRAWLRRRDPDGLALLTGEPVEVTSGGRIRYRERPVAHPAGAAIPTRGEVLPPAVGALRPRTPEGYGAIPEYDRRAVERRRVSDRRTAYRATLERRRGERRSA